MKSMPIFKVILPQGIVFSAINFETDKVEVGFQPHAKEGK